MINKLISELESQANKAFFITSESIVVDDFFNQMENMGVFPNIFKEFLKNCSVENFFEFENEKILIRFKKSEYWIENNINGFFLKNGFFAFADNSDCDIYLLDISTHSKSEVYLGSMDLFDDEERIVFYNEQIREIPLNYENIKKMSIKLSCSFENFISNIINGVDMKYDVVRYVIERY